MKKILKLCLVLLLFYVPLKTKAQCDSLVITDIPCDSVIAAINGLSQYTISGTDTPYSVPFAVAYLEICYPEYNADSIDLAALLHCCHPAGINYSDSTLSYCETAIYFRLLLQYALPHRSCLPSWTYNYLITMLLPQIPVLAADSNISLLCKDVNTCNVNCVSVCDDTIISSCDSINSTAYVYQHILAVEGISIDTNLLVNIYTTLFGYAPPYNTIISQISNCNPDDTAIFTEITYTAANPVYSLDSFGHYYVDFDLLATDTPNNLLFSQGLIYINYDTTTFGSNMVSRGVITATRGIDSFYNLSLSDSTPNLLKLSITHDSTNNLTNLDSINTNRELCHLKINLTSLSTPAVKAAFDTLAMAGHSMYRQTPIGLEFPYDIIRVDGLVGAPRQIEDSIIFSIANATLDDPLHPTHLDFDIMGYSDVDDWLGDYSLSVSYNMDAFDSIYITNTLGVGDNGSNDSSGTGCCGGDPVYSFMTTFYPGTFIISLAADSDFDLTNVLQTSDFIYGNAVAHVRMHIYDCGYTPGISIVPTPVADWAYPDTFGVFEPYDPVLIDSSYNNSGMPMCPPVPRVIAWSPCTNAGSFEVATIYGRHFGKDTGAVFFNSANSPGTFISTIHQDIRHWDDSTIDVLIPSQPLDNIIAASGNFYVQPLTGPSNAADSVKISIGYANYNVRNMSAMNVDYLKPQFVYMDSFITFQLDSALFYDNNQAALVTIIEIMADMNCRTGINFQLSQHPASIDSPAVDNIHLICLKPYSSGLFPSNRTLAQTDLHSRIQSCNNSLTDYNNSTDYLEDVDITIRSDLYGGYTWNWSNVNNPTDSQYDFFTVMEHELGHAALLGHTQPQPVGNIMYPITLPGQQNGNFGYDPDDVLGMQHMLSVGAIVDVGGCPRGIVPTYGAPETGVSSCPPVVSCVERINTINGIAQVPGSNTGSAFTASLYPNPYEGTTVIHIEVSVYAQFSIAVYDLLGQVIRQINIASGSSFDVPLSNFEEGEGLYLIQVSDGHNRQVLKMIKL
jgi:hypothetical protein